MRLVTGILALSLLAGPAFGEDSDRSRNAKTLFFDRKYAEARETWRGLLGAGGPEAETAAYWVARCSESLKEDARAVKEYDDYLARRPADRALAEEARTNRIGLAARLVKGGQRDYLPALREALADTSKTVRYYAAFQLAGLGADVGQPAVPVLKTILRDEKDPDLVDRAKLLLLRIDPGALAPEPATARPSSDPRKAAKAATWVRVRVQKADGKPEVAINVPLALAELIFKSLPDDARRELKLKGYDADNFWTQLKKMGPMEIIHVQGEDGERIDIWLE
jgi:HEAT repeat protein